LGEGRGNTFIEFLKEGRKGDCPPKADWKLQKFWELRRKLYQRAKQEKL